MLQRSDAARTLLTADVTVKESLTKMSEMTSCIENILPSYLSILQDYTTLSLHSLKNKSMILFWDDVKETQCVCVFRGESR